MGKIIKYGVLGFLLFLIFLVATIPANFVLQQLGDQLKGVVVVSPSGTVWNGSASKVIVDQFELSDVDWSFSFLSLLSGAAAFDIRLNDQQITGDATVGVNFSGQTIAHDVALRLPLDMVNPMLQKYNASTMGTVRAEIEAVTWNGQWVENLVGKVFVDRLNVKVKMMSMDTQLGNYAIDLSLDGKQNVVADINGIKDALGLKATAIVTPAKAVEVSGSVQKDLPKDFAGLQMFLKPEGDRLTFKHATKL